MKLNFVKASQIDIYEQLLKEEALFRSDDQNWCILVQGSTPTIVMGAFGQAEQLIDYNRWLDLPLPIVRRYSGGGTVVVNEETLFLCWIINSEAIEIEAYPDTIMSWAHRQIAKAMIPLNLIQRESDYCLEIDGKAQKIIGNAQSIAKKRFVHHSSFLWGYQKEQMELLLMPKKQPDYRQGRSHENFIYSLDQTSLTQEQFQNQLKEHLSDVFELTELPYDQLTPYLEREYRRSCIRETASFYQHKNAAS